MESASHPHLLTIVRSASSKLGWDNSTKEKAHHEGLHQFQKFTTSCANMVRSTLYRNYESLDFWDLELLDRYGAHNWCLLHYAPTRTWICMQIKKLRRENKWILEKHILSSHFGHVPKIEELIFQTNRETNVQTTTRLSQQPWDNCLVSIGVWAKRLPTKAKSWAGAKK